MSLKAMLWAMDDAPVTDQGQLLVLIALAERADEDGRNSFPSKKWLAERARCSPRTVQRHLQSLRASGLIVEGDQRLVDHFRADRRPVVYDLKLTAARGDTVSPRACGKPGGDETPVSPRSDERGDTGGRHGETTVSHKPSLLPTEETTTTTPPADPPVDSEQQQRPALHLIPNTAPDDTIRDLQDAIDAIPGLDLVRWKGLTRTELREIAGLATVHGIPRLVQAVQHARQAHPTPPGHARAWLTLWRDLRPPRSRPPERPLGRCVEHHQTLPCTGCAADRKAAR